MVGFLMKVLIVTPSYAPIIGGSEKLVRNIAFRLNEKGIHTDIMTFNMEKKWRPLMCERVETSDGFKIIKIPAFNPFPFLRHSLLHTPLRINIIPWPSFLRKFKNYDIIHFLGEADLSMPMLASSIKKPKIMHCVGVPSMQNQFKKHTTLRKPFIAIFRRLANIYLVFSWEEKLALAEMGISPNKILVLSHGVNTNFFKPDIKKKIDNLILFVGRIDPVKGLHVLLKSLDYLDIKTQVAVIGPINNSRYFAQIERMRFKLNTKGFHTVNYLGDMNDDSLLSWFQKATVMVRADLVGASGAGYSTLEALACGTPVIGIQNHVILNDVNGLIVQKNNPEQLAMALQKILSNKETRKRYGVAARNTVEKNYNLETVSAKLSEIYLTMKKQL
jgi:glycosyltransferase involved in cell wall biosynthesis